MRRTILVSAMLALLGLSQAHAEQDFYGIQMRDELWAQNLVLGAKVAPRQEDLYSGPVLSQNVYAEASVKDVEDDHLSIRITVFNDSNVPISSDYHFRDFYLYTRDGKRYPLLDMEKDFDLSVIAPKGKVTFMPSSGNLEIRNRDVVMISCSFDLGAQRVFLFPWAKKEMVTKLRSPAPPPAPVPAPVEKKRTWSLIKPRPVEKKETAPAAQAPPPLKVVPAPPPPKPERPEPRLQKIAASDPVLEASREGPANDTPQRNFWSWLDRRNRQKTTPARPSIPTYPASEQAERVSSPEPAPMAVMNDSSAGRVLVNSENNQEFAWPPDRPTTTTRSAVEAVPGKGSPVRLDEAIKNFVYVPATGLEGVGRATSAILGGPAPQQRQSAPAPMPPPAPALKQPAAPPAQVVGYNKSYQFVTMNLGSRDGLKEKMNLNVIRDGRVIAKVVVKQVREAVAAAAVIPKSLRAEIQPGDQISLA